MIICRHQSVDSGMLAQIVTIPHIQAGIAMSAGNSAGYDTIAHSQGLSCRIHCDILAHLNDLAAAFMSQYNRDQAEGIILVLMDVGTADTAALYLDQHLVIADLRNIKLLDLGITIFCAGAAEAAGACFFSFISARTCATIF